MKSLVYILSFFTCLFLFTSCLSEDYQWFFNKQIGIRIDNIKSKNDVIEFKGSIINKSTKTLLLSGYCSDVNNEDYQLYDMEHPVKLPDYNNEIAYRGLMEMEVLPNEKINLYYHSFSKDKDNERFNLLKHLKVDEAYIKVKILSFENFKDTIINVCF